MSRLDGAEQLGAFLNLVGYTRLTKEQGDDAAARSPPT
jgi:hypothetical protein